MTHERIFAGLMFNCSCSIVHDGRTIDLLYLKIYILILNSEFATRKSEMRGGDEDDAADGTGAHRHAAGDHALRGPQ